MWAMLAHFVQTESTVGNGKDAVDRPTIESFDIVLLIMMMPVMGGLEAARRISALPLKTRPFVGRSRRTRGV